MNQEQPANEKELIEQARQQGATHYSPRLGMFWRPCDGGYECCLTGDDGKLGDWHRSWLAHPSESAVRI